MSSHPRTLIAALLLICPAGCASTAPMHVWAPPILESVTGHSVVIAKIVGPGEQAAALADAVREAMPREAARSLTLIDQGALQRESRIQLASATAAVPSDVALLHAARQQQCDFLLLGEILTGGNQRSSSRATAATPVSADDGANPDERGTAADAPPETAVAVAEPPTSFTISWRMLDVKHGRIAGGMPVTVTEQSIARHYPELAELLAVDPERAMIQAAARATWNLLTPYVRTLPARLARPYLLPGSSMVRQGNAMAAGGNWEGAERMWRQVFEAHPSNHAAVHNLALAAAARQRLAEGKRLAQQALEMHRSQSYEQTVVWIEQRQLELVQGFRLPPPEEGWLFRPD